MMFLLPPALVAAGEPLLDGDRISTLSVPYIQCMISKSNLLVEQVARGDRRAGDEADARAQEARMKAEIRARCASERRDTASPAIRLLNGSNASASSHERRRAVERYLKQIEATFLLPPVVPLATTVPFEVVADVKK